MIQNWTAHLEKREIHCLRRLLDKPVREILSPSIRTKDGLISSSNISISFENGQFVIIGNERSETPKLNLDYSILFVQHSNSPDEIRYSPKSLAKPRLLNRRILQLSAPIVKIEVYEGYESLIDRNEQETVHYDHALVFHLKDRLRFCVAAEPTSPDHVDFTTNVELIDKLIAGCRLRMTLKA